MSKTGLLKTKFWVKKIFLGKKNLFLVKKISMHYLPEFVNNSDKMNTNSSRLGAICKNFFIDTSKIASDKFLILKKNFLNDLIN
jgi:hypothetical protein